MQLIYGKNMVNGTSWYLSNSTPIPIAQGIPWKLGRSIISLRTGMSAASKYRLDKTGMVCL